MHTPGFFNDVAHRAQEARESLLKKYDSFLKGFGPFRRLVGYLHVKLNKIQYDPVNPQNRTSDNPDGYQTAEEARLAQIIENDKTLLDKIETYFRLRPASMGILAFFVISADAASARNNPTKIVIAIAIILAILPLLISRQTDFEKIDKVDDAPVE